jgi:hypothetical protein
MNPLGWPTQAPHEADIDLLRQMVLGCSSG